MYDDFVPFEHSTLIFRNERFKWVKRTQGSKTLFAELGKTSISYETDGYVQILDGGLDMRDRIIATAAVLLDKMSGGEVRKLVRVAEIQETPPSLHRHQILYILVQYDQLIS
jgi:hypothetical protein